MTSAKQESETPRLSVVIAAYNAASTLPDQLTALMAQDDRSWEILVCDNGSTDATADIVRAWVQQHSAIRLVDASARRGPAAARNIGVAASRGALIAFCDADDVVADGWADAVESALTDHSFVAGRFELGRLRSGSPFTVSWSPQLEGLTHISYLPGFVTAGAGNMAIRREVFEAIGGFDESASTAEDDDLCLRAQLAGHSLSFVPEMVLHVRQRGGLREVWRQAFGYGIGARRLQYKYALVARGLDGLPAHPPARVQESATQWSWGQLLARLRPALLPSRIANAVWRIAWRRGSRTARVDDIDQVDASELNR